MLTPLILKVLQLVFLTSSIFTNVSAQSTLILSHSMQTDSSRMSRALKMIQTLEQRSNTKFTLHSFPNKRSLHYANIGKVDSIFTRLKTLKLDPKYSNLLLVDASWMEDELVVISKKENSIELSDWADLVGYDIC